MTITLAGIPLPGDLFWSDELAPWKVGQAVTHSLTGAMIVQEAELQAGRPITLESIKEGNASSAWVTRSTVDALLALEAVANAAPMALVLPIEGGGTRTLSVRWRRTDGKAIDVEPISFRAPIVAADFYTLTLRLMQV